MSVFEEYAKSRWTAENISSHQTELATSLRIPFINSPYPRWNYVVAIVVDPTNEKYACWPGLIPTEDEVRMVASFCDEYREHWYNPGFKAAMAKLAPYDIDGGANCAYFIKYRTGGWGFRKRTWIRGNEFVPSWNEDPESLPDVLDRIHDRDSFAEGISKRWLEWKAAHSDVFGVVA